MLFNFQTYAIERFEGMATKNGYGEIRLRTRKNVIDQCVEGLFYASPQKQIEYFDKALGIKIDDEIWGKWVEIKARRDLWVHNAGVVNQVYIDKVKEYKLCDFGNEAVIDGQHFSDCAAILKIMIVRIDRDIRNIYQVDK